MRLQNKIAILAILITLLIAIGWQHVNAEFPTTQQKEEQDLLKMRFQAFILSCENELGIYGDANHQLNQLTINEAMNCHKALNNFKDLTGGSDSDVIGLIVTELRGNGECKKIALSNEAMKNMVELMGKQFTC